MAASDARPVPRKNVAYRVTFPLLDADGDLVTGAAALDSEVSIDGAAFADATSEATEIATGSGVYFLDLTAVEMNGDTVAVIVKTSTTGAKTTVIVLYPEEIGDVRVNVEQFGGTAGTFAAGRPEVNTSHIAGSLQTLVTGRVDANVGAVSADAAAADNLEAEYDGTGFKSYARRGTAQAGSAASITLDAGASATDDLYIGMAVRIVAGTGVGQSRPITDYVGATKVATVVPSWWTAPDATSVFVIDQASWIDVRLWRGSQVEVPSGAGLVQVDMQRWLGATVNALVSGRVDASVGAMAAGSVTAAVIATDAIDADALATDAAQEIRDTVWGVLRRATAQAGAAGTITLDAPASATDDLYNGLIVMLVSGTGAGQARLITDYVGVTKVATIGPNWITAPDGTSIFVLIPWGRVSIGQWLEAAVNVLIGGRIDAHTQAMGSGVIAASTFAAGAIDAAAIAAGAIDADALATDAVNEIRDAVTNAASGTADAGSTATTIVDAERTEATIDYWQHSIVLMTGGASAGQLRRVTAFNAATDSLTVSPGFKTAVAAGDTYVLMRLALADGLRPAVEGNEDVDVAANGDVGADVQTWLGAAMNVLVSGRVDASVGAMAAAVLTAAAIATDAITADKIAAAAIGVSEAPNLDAAISSRLAPTIAGRTLDIAAGGEAGIDLDNTIGALAKGTEITGFNDLSAAAVNAEVLDVLNVDTFAEPGQEAPAATATLVKKLGYLYKAFRNRITQTSSTLKVYGDDAATVDQKATVSDDGTTYDRGEIGSGP